MNLTAKVENVTPEKAARWLEKSAPNRHIREGTVLQHAQTMDRGEWHLTGEAIKFDENGLLLDGQHRLRAVEVSGATVPMLIVRNVPNDAMVVMDTGIKRQLADVLQLRGEVSAQRLAATLTTTLLVRTAFKIGKWPHARHGKPTNDWALQLLEQEPGIREAVRESTLFKNAETGLRVFPKTWGVALHHLPSVDATDAESFFYALKTGADLAEDDVLYKFRKLFLASRLDVPNTARDQIAYMFKAWNLWRRGENPQQLKVRFGGHAPEKFPVPE